MKNLRKLALRYDTIAYIYAAGVVLLTTAPLAIWWVLLHMLVGR